MYSFEGDFRRKPEQNLSGASSSYKNNRDALLHKAHQERQKREEHRRRLNSAIKIQAYVRSFLTRSHHKRKVRLEFDVNFKGDNINKDLLEKIIKQLLFFYDKKEDVARLISVSQQILKHWRTLVLRPGVFMQIRRMLAHHVQVLNNTKGSKENFSVAVPLRMLEVFTSVEVVTSVMDHSSALRLIADTNLYIVRRGYYKELRTLLDVKSPPLYGISTRSIIPLCDSILDLIQRPMDLIKFISDKQYSYPILLEFACWFVCPQFSDPIQWFVLPTFKTEQDRKFPFIEFIRCLREDVTGSQTLDNSSWLLHGVLALEPPDFASSLVDINDPNESEAKLISNIVVLEYLSLLAHLTVNVCNKSIRHEYKDTLYSQQSALDNDSDSDSSEEVTTSVRETIVLAQCIEMLNEREKCVMTVCTQAQEWNDDSLESLSQICHNLLLSHRMALHKYRLLYTLAFKPGFLRSLWHWMSGLSYMSAYGGHSTPLLAALSRGAGAGEGGAERILPPLAVFCALFSLLIGTLHDSEFIHNDDEDEEAMSIPDKSLGNQGLLHAFTFSQLGPLCLALRQVCLGLVELAFPEARPTVRDDYRSAVLNIPRIQRSADEVANAQRQTAIWAHLFKVTVHLLRQLYARDTRLHFCSAGEWTAGGVGGVGVVAELALAPVGVARSRRPFRGYRSPGYTPQLSMSRADADDKPPMTTKEIRTVTILREIPFVVPFSSRVLIFQGLVMRDKTEHQGDLASFLQGPSIEIMIRRSHLYEDAFDKLSPENEPDLRLKMRVALINAAGANEAGVDGGGLFREFLSELLRSAFDPNRGLFRLTKDNMLYPNPAVHLLYEDFTRHYYFVGRMLGKALYENLLVELPLAEFFVGKLSSSHEADVHQLASLDPGLYRGLLLLKAHRKQDVADLGLDFTVLSDELGEQRIEDLKPGGANIQVTAENRIEYIHLVADYKLNRQIRSQCASFKHGLTSVVSADWLRMFSSRELQLLISGAETNISVEDLKQHTNYSGGYTAEHPTIKAFWKAVDNFTDTQRRQLLKFVTSCSRPPLLGFKELDPPFCIQYAGTSDRLPSASTCMNLLKLPDFPNQQTLEEKLLYAIQAGAGFELS